MDTFGWVLYKKGEYQRALKYLSDAFRINPDIFCIHYHLGASYAALNDFENAMFHFLKQIKRNPNDRDGIAAAKSLREIMEKSKSES